ncbi:tetratricopeptide repeat protein [Streptomyces sp. NPDC091292]|uniref:tetratricopeptide repeat protein n=1 Tax=Streptomyces sp. NPDC091292 TaxID=3365991 RepID=UPI0037F490FA
MRHNQSGDTVAGPEQRGERVVARHDNTIGGAAHIQGAAIQARDVRGGIHIHEAPPDPLPPRPRQLLPVPAHFTNRRTDLAALDRLFGEAATARPAQPLIVVSGPAGVGKTTLASKWLRGRGADFPDGHLYVDLRGHAPDGPADPGEALGQFLRGLGARTVPATLTEQASLWRSVTAGLRIAVMLDNAFTAAQVRPLLPGAPESLVVVTSRRALSGLVLDGGRFHRVGTLAPADGMELLTRAIGEDRVAGELSAAGRVVALCAGLPLAVCLASARLAARPEQPLEAMARALTGATGRLAALDLEGEATVSNALDASYAVLSPDAALLYRRVGLLPVRTFDAHLAAAACDRPLSWAERALDALIDAHLVEDNGSAGCRFHDLVRIHAHDKASADEPPALHEETLRRVCDWHLRTATAAQARLTPAQYTLPRTYAHPSDLPPPFTDDLGALAWLDDRRLTLMTLLRSAADSGWHDTAWQLVDAMWPLFLRLRHYDLWVTAHEIGLESARRAGDKEAERQMLNSGAIGLSAARRLREAADWYRLSLDAAREAGDVRDEGQALLGLGACHREAGEFTDAVPRLHEAIAAWERSGYPRGVALARIVLGEIALERDDPEQAMADFTRARDQLIAADDPQGAGRALAFLGRARSLAGDYPAGRAQLEEALTAFTASGATHWRARTLEMLARSARDHGDTSDADDLTAQAIRLYETTSPADARRLSGAEDGAGPEDPAP